MGRGAGAVMITGVTWTLAAALVGCPADPSALCAYGDCEPGTADAGGTSDGSPAEDSGPFAPGCAPSPAEDPSTIREACGVFVAPSGDDLAEGSATAPYRTLARGLAVAKAANKHVFVCAGVYDEALVVDAAVDGLQIHGGFTCPGEDGGAPWSYGTGPRARVSLTLAGPALRIDGLTTGLLLEDMEFRARDESATGVSSVGGLVRASSAVTLRRVRIQSGAAGSGTPGDTPGGAAPAPTPATGSSIDGKSATDNNGAGTQTCTCGADVTMGGRGGDNAEAGGGNGSAGTANGLATPYPPSPTLNDTGAGGSGRTTLNQCVGGFRGAMPPDGTVGTGGTAAWSVETNGAFMALPSARGASGQAGGMGQGGGGGGGGNRLANLATGGGGGGACGGCGGKAGGGGSAAGSSVALVLVDASLAIRDSELVAGAGGTGGKGGSGQDGSVGGFGGAQATASGGNGCGGGDGGKGGKGGGGGGGAGGASLVIAHRGPAPALEKVVMTAGTRGVGGEAGDGTSAGHGQDGIADTVRAFAP